MREYIGHKRSSPVIKTQYSCIRSTKVKDVQVTTHRSQNDWPNYFSFWSPLESPQMNTVPIKHLKNVSILDLAQFITAKALTTIIELSKNNFFCCLVNYLDQPTSSAGTVSIYCTLSNMYL